MRSRSDPIGASTSSQPVCALVAICLLAGCSGIDLRGAPLPLPAAVTPEGVRARMIEHVTLDTAETADSTIVASDKPKAASTPSFLTRVAATTPVVASFVASESSDPPQVYSLPQAIDFGLQNNPRLAAALAAIERARGQEDVAFAAFLPEIDFLTHEGVTSPSLGPASAGATGIIVPTATATHAYAQAEVQLQWTLYDFGRTGGRYHEALARERIAELQSNRVKQTVGFDVASAYLLTLRAGATRRIQEEAIRRAEATLRDTRSRRAAGVLEKDDVLRAEV
jgi:outer membrane protein TolC